MPRSSRHALAALACLRLALTASARTPAADAPQVETIQTVARDCVASVSGIRAAIDDFALIAETSQAAVREPAASGDSQDALASVPERVAAVSSAATTVRDASADIATEAIARRDVIDAVVVRLRHSRGGSRGPARTTRKKINVVSEFC